MNLPKTAPKMTASEYLELERAADFKSEFHDGEMFAMAGGHPPHNILTANISRALGNRLEGRGCVTFSPDQRVKVEAAGAYFYPDVSVACPPKYEDDLLLNPTVLVEVLSESTAFRDRVEKWDLYRKLPSLQEYLLVSQHDPHIVQYTRQSNGGWLQLDVVGLTSSLTLSYVGISVPLAEIYANVDFAPVTAAQPSATTANPPKS